MALIFIWHRIFLTWDQQYEAERENHHEISSVLLDPQLVEMTGANDTVFVMQCGVRDEVPATQAVGKHKVRVKCVDVHE